MPDPSVRPSVDVLELVLKALCQNDSAAVIRHWLTESISSGRTSPSSSKSSSSSSWKRKVSIGGEYRISAVEREWAVDCSEEEGVWTACDQLKGSFS